MLSTGHQFAYRLPQPRRHDRPCRSKLRQVVPRESASDRFKTFFDLVATQPRQGADGEAGRPARRDELPTRGMPQLNDLGKKPQRACRSRCKVDGSNRHLSGETKHVCRSPTAADNRLAPESRQSRNCLFDGRRVKPEPGLDRSHIHPAADPEQPSTAGQTRQGLVDRRTIAQMKERTRTDRCCLGQRLRVLHDAFRQAGHGIFLSSFQQVSETQ